MTSTRDADTRDRILAAARVAFRERGTSGARMQDIADAAGVNKALLHYYFRNKESLADSVFQGELRRLVQPVMETLAGDLDLREKVRKVVALYLDRLQTTPALPGYVLAELNFHPDRIGDFMESVMEGAPGDVGQGLLSRLEWQIAAAAARGEMRRIPAREFMVNLLALCVFPFAARPLMEFMILGDTDFEDFMADRRHSLPDFFLRALRP